MKATIKAHQRHAGGVLGNEIETRVLQCLDGEIGAICRGKSIADPPSRNFLSRFLNLFRLMRQLKFRDEHVHLPMSIFTPQDLTRPIHFFRRGSRNNIAGEFRRQRKRGTVLL